MLLCFNETGKNENKNFTKIIIINRDKLHMYLQNAVLTTLSKIRVT